MKNKIKTKAPNIDVKLPPQKEKATKKGTVHKKHSAEKGTLGEGQGDLGCCEFRMLSSAAIGLWLKEQTLLLTAVEAGGLRSGSQHGPSGENPGPGLQMAVLLTRQRR